MAGTIDSALCTSFKVELLTGTHNFTNAANAFKVALLKTEAAIASNYGAATVDYDNVSTDEVANGSGYTTGGAALTNATPTSSSTTAYTDFTNDPEWTSATFDTGGAIIYNTSASNRAVAVIDFGGTKSVTNGTFKITWPTADASNAIIRIA
jgi:hypothetical protein